MRWYIYLKARLMAKRRLEWTRFLSGYRGHLVAVLLIGACGRAELRAPVADAGRDAGPPTSGDGDPSDTPLAPDLTGAAEIADSPVGVADAPFQAVDLPPGSPDASSAPVDSFLAPVDTRLTGETPTPMDAGPVDASEPPCRVFPLGASAWDGGAVRWLWRYDPRVADLRGLCAGYGARPKLILEVVVKGADNPLAPLPICTTAEVSAGSARACSVGDAYRFVADCETADMLLELPTGAPGFDAYVHIESATVKSSPRQMAVVDPRCPRQLVGGMIPWSGMVPVADGGVAGPEVGADAGDPTCSSYPSTSRVDSSGKAYWWFNFNWRQPNLADICASYGAGAKMVVELWWGSTPSPVTGLPTCTGFELMGAGGRSCAAGARLETDCTAGQMLFEADAETGSEYDAYFFHIESPQFPDPPRRLIEPDATCPRYLHPRFMPMAPAGSPDVGEDTGGDFADVYDPSRYGQPCQTNADCPLFGQECVIGAPVSDCLAGPIGRCVLYMPTNCVAFPNGCYCLHTFGNVCADAPGTACGNIYPPGSAIPTNPQTGTRCHACLPASP